MGQHHKYQRALMLGPVGVVAVASAVAMPLVFMHSPAQTTTTSPSARASYTFSNTAQDSAVQEELARRSSIAAASRSAQRTARLATIKAAEKARAAQIQAARARAATAARERARIEANAREMLRLQKVEAAELLVVQRQAQVHEQVRLERIKSAAVLVQQQQLQALEAQRLAASRAAQRARETRSSVKVTYNAARLGSPKAYAQSLVGTGKQFECLVLLWNRESGWNYRANNPSSSAYGIPQALPGSKMASAGADWRTNPATQIRWGLGYIHARYGTPCGAWAHSQSAGWY